MKRCGFALTIALLSLIRFAAGADPAAKDASTNGKTSDAGKITFKLPRYAHVTVAIDNADGVRVRNLFADVAFKQGEHTVEWDGRDDAGKKVAAGEYHWRGLLRGDLHAVYQGAFQYGNPPWLLGKTGGWTGDHSYAVTVTAAGNRMLLGSTEAEWGHGVVAVDLDGKKLWGQRWLAQTAWAGGDSFATVGSRVFASSYPEMNTVWEVDPQTGESWFVVQLADLPKDKVNAEVRLPGLKGPGLRVVGGHATDASKSGDGELYAADLYGKEDRTYVFSTTAPNRGKLKLLRVLPVRPWSLTWLPDGRCIAVMDKTLDVLDTQTGRTTPLVAKGLEAPYCVASDARGRIFVSDQGGYPEIRWNPDAPLPHRSMRITDHPSMQIKIFDDHGKLLRAMGREGGQQPGKIDPNNFWRPAGIAIDARGRLWVTEMTNQPRRVSVWNIPDDLAATAPSLTHEFFGPTYYGGGASIIDPAKPWRIMDTNFGVIFDVNLDTGAYRPVEFPWRPFIARKERSYNPDLPMSGKPTTVIKIGDREFSFLTGGYEHGPEAHWMPYVGNDDGCVIGELRNGVFVPLSAIGNIRVLLRARELNARVDEQWLPKALLEAAKRRPDWKQLCARAHMDPEMADAPHIAHDKKIGEWILSPWPKELSGFIWTDANGDGKMQADEIEIAPLDDSVGVTFDRQLNAYISVQRAAPPFTLKLARDGFNAIGAPVYRWPSAQRFDGGHVVDVGDDGSMLDFTSLRAADGKLRWTYPSDRRGATELASRKWQEMLPGAINRIHALRGVVKGPGELGDVYMLQSTDGMCYLLTRDDGLFIGTLFKPFPFAPGWDTLASSRRGQPLEFLSLQDECFNGSFAQAQTSGQGFEKDHFYLTGLGRSAVCEVTGLQNVKRLSGGSVKLVDGAGLYAKATPTPAVPLELPPGVVELEALRPKGPIEASHDSQFLKGTRFADAEVFAAWDQRGLHWKWVVKSDTLFINNETDWTMLFSTGDVCDLQLLSPKLGRCRYIVTMYKGQPIAVRFQYDAKEGNRVVYKSGVTEYRVPSVDKLDVTPTVRRLKDSYVVQFTLPWETLGINAKVGLEIPVELGVFRADRTGTKTAVRNYWHSGAIGMVSDVPTEAAPTSNWGVLILK